MRNEASTLLPSAGLAGDAAKRHHFERFLATLRVRIAQTLRRETLVLRQILVLAALVSLTASGPIAAQAVPAAVPPIKRTLVPHALEHFDPAHCV
jgi:hypothetical protein